MTAADILPPNVIKRIERIAAEADRTPAQIMKFILRDGIERTEESVKAVTKSRKSLAAGKGVPLETVLAQAATLLKHGKSHKKAA